MNREVVALGDVGASQQRLVLKELSGLTIADMTTATNRGDYDHSVNEWVDSWTTMADGRTIVAATLAIAASVDPVTGTLIQAGDLNKWIGRTPGQDISRLLNRPAGARNDVAAIAASQIYINARNKHSVDGVAYALSSGWGGALYDEHGRITDKEPGHEDLRDGAICTCGVEGHAEAWIAGNGKQKNTDMTMEDWLNLPGSADELATDIATAVVADLTKNEAESGFWPEELRWTGGVYLHQPFVMQDAAEQIRARLGKRAPAFDTATMMGQAGIHGSFIFARELAQAA